MTDCSTTASQGNADRRLLVAQIVAALTVVLFLAAAEVNRYRNLPENAPPLAWLFTPNIDTTPFLPWLLILPWAWRRTRRMPMATAQTANWGHTLIGGRGLARAWLLCAIVAGTSIAVSMMIANRRVPDGEGPALGDLPPAYHDEYSYLFQARAFLAGRVSFPSHPQAPRLFDQMHVLNEGRFASRYFPGTGFWLAPFVAWGHPYWGYWLAGAVSSSLVFFTGRELADNRTGFFSGLALAASPGVGIFSNLLLAHHPTLVGLSLFLFAFVRLMRTRHAGDGVLVGIGLSFAMLCRPMTAAGFGLPFGIWLLVRTIRPGVPLPLWPRIRPALTVGVPVAAGLVGMLFYNSAITGDAWKTPYQVYTDIYTPRHVYGFNNGIRGEQHVGPRVLTQYDKWAKNLTPALAVENVRNRAIASAQWTLGIVPLLAMTVFTLIAGVGSERRWWLIPAAIVSLHAVHVPYWYDGIMHWHYVFETCLLIALVFGVVTARLFDHWHAAGRRRMPWWWLGVVATGVLVSYVPFPPSWTASRLSIELEQLAFARVRYAAFNDMVATAITDRPALLLIQPDPADRSMDYVVNSPALNGEVLRGRWPQPDMTLDDVRAAFPERAIYVFDVRSQRLVRAAGR